jgi:uncharacterized LabA/DUF88 family protein
MVKNRTIVYIDGENLLHRVEESLKEYKLISKKEQILHFALRDLLKACLSDLEPDEIRYYSTKIRTSDIKDKNILEYAQIIVDSQRRFKRDLLNQDITFVVAGSLRVREAKCFQCKKTSLVFKEKGVDVRLAVDLITESAKGVTQVLVSSDSDLLPAVRQARLRGSTIIYAHHAEKPNYALIKSSQETRVFTKNQIKQAYEASNKKTRK